jgi:hypothetical protein
VIPDGCPSDFEDTDAATLHLPHHIFQMQLEQLDRLKLMAPNEHTPAEGGESLTLLWSLAHQIPSPPSARPRRPA